MFSRGLARLAISHALIALVAAPALADKPHNAPEHFHADENAIIADEHVFSSWTAYFTSDYFRSRGLRCGTAPLDPNFLDPQNPADCSYNSTNPTDDYDPSVQRYRIPVVFHVIRRSNGTTGHIPESQINNQIDVLNEDFLAIPGSNGAPGTDIQIEFYLATTDPDGQPTTGITYSNNDTWYNDSGQYYNTLAWDPHRYLNIYTNTASGALGYVPFLPQNGSPGSKADRVVVLWSTVGKNAPYGPPYNQGRTVTHEVGHYLGLFHTFDGGCGTSSCYTTADRICDTERESQPAFGCPTSRSTCNDPDPVRNYMDYSDDLCMNNFTPEQARRMRCTLENYRPLLWEDGALLQLSAGPLNWGQNASFTAEGAAAGETVYFIYSLTGEGSTFVPFLNVTLGLDRPALGGTAVADAGGTANLNTTLPGGNRATLIWLQAAHAGVASNVLLTQINP